MVRQQLHLISFQQLQVFISLAQTFNFTQTAQDLEMTQSGVSRSLSKLEEIVGKPLFKRTTKRVILTPAGEACYQAWQEVIDIFEQGYKKACAQKIAYEEELTVGVAIILDCDILHRDYFKPFKEACEYIKLNIIDGGFQDELQQGIADVMIMPEVEKYSLRGGQFSWKYIYRHPLYMLVPDTSPFADARGVYMKDILHIPNLVRHPETNTNPLAFLRDLYRPFDIEPPIGSFYRSNYEIESMLARSSCMCIVGDFFPTSPIANIRRIPILDTGTGIIAAWNKEKMRKSVTIFLDFICAD